MNFSQNLETIEIYRFQLFHQLQLGYFLIRTVYWLYCPYIVLTERLKKKIYTPPIFQNVHGNARYHFGAEPGYPHFQILSCGLAQTSFFFLEET